MFQREAETVIKSWLAVLGASDSVFGFFLLVNNIYLFRVCRACMLPTSGVFLVLPCPCTIRPKAGAIYASWLFETHGWAPVPSCRCCVCLPHRSPLPPLATRRAGSCLSCVSRAPCPPSPSPSSSWTEGKNKLQIYLNLEYQCSKKSLEAANLTYFLAEVDHIS